METCRRARVRRVMHCMPHTRSLKSVNCCPTHTSSPAHAPIPVISPTVTFLSRSILSGEREIYSELKYAYATQNLK